MYEINSKLYAKWNKKPKKHMVKENLKSNFALCILLPLIAAENFF